MPEKMTKSQKKIRRAFIELLTEKQPADIHVSDITRKAGLNRGTFYLYYLNKEDLEDSIAKDIQQKFRKTLAQQNFRNRDSIIKALQLVQEDWLFFRTVSKLTFLEFSKKLRQLLESILVDNRLFLDKIEEASSLPREYAVASLSAAIGNLVCHWIAKDMKDSPEKIADMILTLDQLFCAQNS